MAVVRPMFFWPLVLTASNNKLVVNNGTSDATITIAAGTYLSPYDLATALQTAISAHVVGLKVDFTIQNSRNVQSDRSGKFVFYSNGSPFTIKAGDVLSTIYNILGFYALTYASGAIDVQLTGGVKVDSAGVIAPRQHQNGWYPEIPPQTDTLLIRDRGMNVHTRAVAGQTKLITEVELGERTWRFQYLLPHKTYLSFEAAGVRANEAVENMWQNGSTKFRYFSDETSPTSGGDFVLSQDSARRFEPKRQFTKKGLYEFEFNAWSYVP